MIKLQRFVNFGVLVYAKYWFKCPSAIDAPINDLKLFKDIQMYDSVDSKAATPAMNALKRHLWSLTTEFAPIILFSQEITVEEKVTVAKKLSLVKNDEQNVRPHGLGYGKPLFPSIDTLTSSVSDVSCLIGEGSWIFFQALGVQDTSFLSEDPDKWPENRSFQDCQKRANNIMVVNDAAERGVKLTTDFISSCREEENFQNTLQVVEENRQLVTNIRKNEDIKCMNRMETL